MFSEHWAVGGVLAYCSVLPKCYYRLSQYWVVGGGHRPGPILCFVIPVVLADRVVLPGHPKKIVLQCSGIRQHDAISIVLAGRVVLPG